MSVPSKPPAAPRWPDAWAALGEGYAAERSRRLKYALRLLLTAGPRAQVMAFAAGSPAAKTLLACAPRAFYPVMRKHIDRRLGGAARARALVESVRGFEARLPPAMTQALCRGEPVEVATLPDGTRARLNLNRLTFDEGLWGLDLADPQGGRLFTLSFGCLEAGTLAIGCVQGAPREIDGLQSARELTKAAEGLRPPHLLMHLLRACAPHWGVRRLVGIDEAFQSKGRWNHRAKDRMFDYDLFWTEVGGTRQPDGNWSLPMTLPQRPLEDVPAKRRAMYRRRQALLEALGAEVRHVFAPALEAVASA